MGKPRKEPWFRNTVMSVTVNAGIKERIAEVAAAEHCSMSLVVDRILARSFAERDRRASKRATQ